MTDRTTHVLLGCATLALVSTHLAIKPGLKPEDIHAAAGRFSVTAEWNGRLAKDFELPLRDGTTFHLADHVGRDVIVLNFFATWCVPCREEMPELQAYSTRAAGSTRIVLIGVDAQEPPEQVDQFIARYGVRFPVAIDRDGEVLRGFGVAAYPTTVVVGADGRIALYQIGAIRNADVTLNTVVAQEIGALARTGPNPRDAYLRARAAERGALGPRGFTPPDDAAVAGLSGRALAIAEAMPCPCGCDGLRVVACTCQTAKGIKARLRAGVDARLSDREVMETLNKEFCMKGM